MSTFKKLASDTALYGISTILARMINFFLVPIQTYAFGKPAELSSNVEFYAYIGVLLALYTLGLETAFFRFAVRNTEQRQRVFNDSLSIVMAVSIVPTVFFILFAHQIAVALDYPGQERFIIWSALLVAIDAIVSIPFARLRAENRARQFVKAKVINILIVVALNVLFLVVCKDIYEGDYLTILRPAVGHLYDPTIGPGYIFLANLIGNALYVFVLRKAFAGFSFRLNWTEVRILLVYAFPIMLTNLVGIINSLTDRLFLRHWLPADFYSDITPKDALSIYGQCVKLAVLMMLAINSFKFAADPFFFSRAEDKNSPKLLADVTKWFIIVCVLLWVAVCLNLDVVGLAVAPAYRRGLDVVPIMMLGYLLIGVYYNISFWFKLSDKTKFGTLITVIGAAVTIGLNVLLIPMMGYMGCAVAFLTSSFTMMALCYVLGEKYYPVPYHLRSAFGYIAGAGLLIYLSLQFPIADLWVSIPVHMALLGVFFVIILFVERDTFQPALARFRNRGKKPVQSDQV
jgi:O-antigen/teichoic acid export membrane protein